jgi:hypothetical protein
MSTSQSNMHHCSTFYMSFVTHSTDLHNEYLDQFSLTPSELTCPTILSIFEAQNKTSNQKQKPSTRWYYIKEQKRKKKKNTQITYKPREARVCVSGHVRNPSALVGNGQYLLDPPQPAQKLGRHESTTHGALYHDIRAYELEKRMGLTVDHCVIDGLPESTDVDIWGKCRCMYLSHHRCSCGAFLTSVGEVRQVRKGKCSLPRTASNEKETKPSNS